MQHLLLQNICDSISYIGQKLTISGSITGTLQGADCDNDFYQPLKFWTSENSRCVFEKSYCSGEGQVIFSNGTTKEDRSCRCDYTTGYDFIVRPKQQCQCEPAEEDCSCYLNLCSSQDRLSQSMRKQQCLMTNLDLCVHTCIYNSVVSIQSNN